MRRRKNRTRTSRRTELRRARDILSHFGGILWGFCGNLFIWIVVEMESWNVEWVYIFVICELKTASLNRVFNLNSE